MRVVIADDSVLLREGVASVLVANGFDVVAQLGDTQGLLAAIDAHDADVVVLDVRMPPTHTDEGIRAAEELAGSRPSVGVLLLSHFVEAQFVVRLLEHKTTGRGYLLKENVDELGTLVSALQTVGAGGSYVDPHLVRHLLARQSSQDALSVLSPRELEILGLMAGGRSNGAIGEQLFLSPKTVETHIRNILSKLGIGPTADDDRRVMAVLRYLRSTGGG